MSSHRALIYLIVAVCFIAACSNVRHPLDDSEERPETEVAAVDEAEETLETIDDSVLGDSGFREDTWSAEDGCETAPFAPSQGEVGLVLIRTYADDALEQVGSPEDLLEDFESFWTDRDESVSRSSPNMDPGVVSRVNGIGYDLVSMPPEMVLRAFIPCY